MAVTKGNSFRKPMKGDRERRQQLEDDVETSKEYYLILHTRACLYADENDQGVREKLTVKKGEETIIGKMGWKPKDSGLG